MGTKNSFAVNEYYHLYNRGVEKRVIFLDNKDHLRFVSLLYVCNTYKHINIRDLFPLGLSSGKGVFDMKRGEQIVDIGAYCLMPNHFHLLVREKIEGGLSYFMKKVLTAYSMYFNKKYERTGRLFEGSFKSKHVNNNEHLKYLFAYIHLNPVKIIDPKWKENGIGNREEAEKYLNFYRYSSYLDVVSDNRIESKILNKEMFPNYFSNNDEFQEHINFWLNYNNLP